MNHITCHEHPGYKKCMTITNHGMVQVKALYILSGVTWSKTDSKLC